MRVVELGPPQRDQVACLVAVMAGADGRLTDEELRALGMDTPLAEAVRHEVARGRVRGTDVVAISAGLAFLPHDTRLDILAMLAAVAVSDRCLALREMEVFTTIARALGIPPVAATGLLERALLRRGSGARVPSVGDTPPG